jgi:hypothetical protein
MFEELETETLLLFEMKRRLVEIGSEENIDS